MLLFSKLVVIYVFLIYEATYAQLTNLQCDFSDASSSSGSFCSWNPSNANYFRIVDGHERDAGSAADGPLGSLDNNGKFIQLKEKSASMESPDVQGSEFCLSFYYYLFGASTGEISISRTARTGVRSAESETVFYRNQDHDSIDKWHLFQSTVYGQSDLSYKYTVATKRQDGTEIAIDKVVAVSGKCEATRYYCDFDFALGGKWSCPWATFITSDDKVAWKAYSGDDKKSEIGRDHSSRSAHGSYLTLEGFETAAAGSVWSIILPMTYSSEQHCFSFWIYQNSPVELTLYRRDIGLDVDPVVTTIWTSVKAGPTSWVKKSFTVAKSDYSPLFDVKLDVKKIGNSRRLSFDSFMYSEGQCRKPATCDFDDDFCGFEISETKWLIGKGRVANPGALGSDFVPPLSDTPYAYVDLSLSAQRSAAVLNSDYVSPGDYCLRWTDFHSKSDDNAFEIHAVDSHGKKLVKVYELTDSDTLGKFSSHAQPVLAGQLTDDFRLLFFVDSVLGFTALDNVELELGSCDPPVVDHGQTLDKYGSCDFQNGMCAWSNQHHSQGGARWDINTPVGYKKRSFAYVATTSQKGEEAVLKMKYFTSTTAASRNGEYCFSFSSIMEGDGEKNLTLNIKAADVDESITLTPSTDWKLSKTEFDVTNTTTSIEFSLIAYAEPDAFVAIDEINIYSGECRRLDDQASLTFYKCEFQNDEKCEIIIDSVYQNNIPSWARRTMEVRSFQRDQGISTEIQRPSKSGKTRFYLPAIQPQMKTCLKFWYLTEIAENVKFRVFLEKGFESEDSEPTSVTLFETSENLGRYWSPALIQITDKRRWRLGFEAEVSGANNWKNIIAVDSIAIQGGTCPDYYSCMTSDESCLWGNMKEVTANVYVNARSSWERQQTQLVLQSTKFPRKGPEGKDGSYFLTTGQKDDALLLSPRFSWPASEDVKHACLTFYDHYIDTDGGGTIFLATDLRSTTTVIKNMHGDGSPSGQWVKKNVQINRSDKKSFWIIIYARTARVRGSFNALGDLKLEFTKCA